VVFIALFFVCLKFHFESEGKGKVKLAFFWTRKLIGSYRKKMGEFPILRDQNSNFWDADWLSCVILPSEDGLASFPWNNPISGKFDWLAEDASGTLYSATMPDSILFASPPIRVVNIRCPLTASDPPYFEDFTKW